MGGVRPSDGNGRDGPREEELGVGGVERSPRQGVEDGWDREGEAVRLKGDTQPSCHHCSI